MTEKVPLGLEYQITGKIRKLNNKLSALLNLAEPVQVRLFCHPLCRALPPSWGSRESRNSPGWSRRP